MAGDWIKMRTSLWTDPKVVTLSSQLSVTRAHVIGALHCAWSIADQHADANGCVRMSASGLDSLCETPGLATAMESVGWLSINEASLQFVNYQEHNGRTAKQRAEAQKRQQASRFRHRSVTESCDKSVTREEKRREDNKNPPTPVPGECESGSNQTPPKPSRRKRAGDEHPLFARFWEAYPRHEARAKAAAAFARLNPDADLLDKMLAAIACQRASGCLRANEVDGRSTIPHPASWLNARRWEDEPPERNGLPMPTRGTPAPHTSPTVPPRQSMRPKGGAV